MPPWETGCSSPDAGGDDCTTKFENTHRIVRREILYRLHPWFGRHVFVHEVVNKAAASSVFRCTFDGSRSRGIWKFPHGCSIAPRALVTDTSRSNRLSVWKRSAHQVLHNRESGALQYAMRDRLTALGFTEIEVIDEDLGRSAAGSVQRSGFERMVAEVCLGKVGAVCAREVSRFARNGRDWQQLIEMCRVVDTVLVDQETIYAPRHGNDRLLLGLKGSLNEYELDLLRQRSLSARHEKARRGELVVSAPVGFVKVGDRYEKDPDRRVQAAISLVLRQDRGTRKRSTGIALVPRAKPRTSDEAEQWPHGLAATELRHSPQDGREPSVRRRICVW